MQKLHLVGFTPELDGLILSARKGAKSGSFVVKVDAAVLQQLSESTKGGSPARTNGIRPSHAPRSGLPESSLGPREMQELLRAGWTVDEVALEAGADVDWVSRFASPVLAEMRRVLDQARDATFDKPRVGPSALPLAASVRRTVAERGVRFTDEDFDAAWRAHQLDEVMWVIGFDYLSRGRKQHAEWTIDLDTGDLASHNRLGAQLGHVQSARRRVNTAPPAKAKPKSTAKRAQRAPATPPAPAKVVASAPSRARSRKPATAPAKKAASGAKSTKPRAAATEAPSGPSKRPRDVYREALRSRGDHERAAVVPVTSSTSTLPPAPAPAAAPAPAPAPAERATARPEPERRTVAPPPPPPAAEPMRPVAIIGPTVRTLTRRATRPAPALEPAPAPPRPRRRPAPAPEPDDTGPTPVVGADEGLPDLRWSPRGNKGPLPPPDPLPVPEKVREKVAMPLGTVEDDELGAETWFPKGPTFKGAQAATQRTDPEPPRRRRTEPLRGR